LEQTPQDLARQVTLDFLSLAYSDHNPEPVVRAVLQTILVETGRLRQVSARFIRKAL